MDPSGIDLRDAVDHVPDLVSLFSSAWWTANRGAAPTRY